MKFRVKIAVKAREYKPIYHYTESYSKAVQIKFLITSITKGPV